MFSVENLYHILYDNVFNKFNIRALYFFPFGSVKINDLHNLGNVLNDGRNNIIYFQDQEPITDESKISFQKFLFSYGNPGGRLKIFCSSEKSELVEKICKENKFFHLYYFFHGLAALDWYRDAKYLSTIDNSIQSPYMSLNRLCTNLRSYRLYLVSELLEQNLLELGIVSLQLNPKENLAKKEIFDSNSYLSIDAKKLILKHLVNKNKNFVADQDNITGNHSSHFGKNELKFWQRSLFHIVSETVFYEEKLHLTEKIFKPIVVKRPFMLVGAYKNLEYLKSYGFKTFDKWIDESYDNEKDPDKRIQLVVKEIAKISKLNNKQLHDLKKDMQSTLDYNFNHFFGNFKEIVIGEFLDNLQFCFNQWNNGRLDDMIFKLNDTDKQEIKQLLLQ